MIQLSQVLVGVWLRGSVSTIGTDMAGVVVEFGNAHDSEVLGIMQCIRPVCLSALL